MMKEFDRMPRKTTSRPPRPGLDAQTRTQLVQLAKRRARLHGGESAAEDISHDALIAAIEASPANPSAYAFAAAKNLCAKSIRDAGKHVEAGDERSRPEGAVESSEVVASELQELAHLDAALEQFVMWSGSPGATFRIVSRLEEIDRDEIVERLRYYLAVIEQLPCGGERQRRRIRAKFTEKIRAALARSGVSWGRPTIAAEPDEEGAELARVEEEESPASQPTGRSVPVIVEPYASGVMLAHRLVPGISDRRALAIAIKAWHFAIAGPQAGTRRAWRRAK